MAGDTFEFKRALRRELRQRRAALDPRQRLRHAQRATATLSRSAVWRNARTIALYLASGNELPTVPLLQRAWREGKRTLVPRIADDGHLRFVEIRPGSRLRRNRYGIGEPVDTQLWPLNRVDLLLLPLVGFDRHGYRLGAGGGFYDRTLAHRVARRPLCLGWALSIQEVDAVPRDPWDRRMDGVVTEQGVRRWPIG
ncbi:5-formyltetrahydrofolate cyclo-ligase [Sinimarinibacterium sp. CAU 1509]|nr:5-formyltetrahydrofolate cyclo-ligase [Sinimarinibacterium sp. CAU 1509]